MRWLALGSVTLVFASTTANAQVVDGLDLSGPESASVTSRWFSVDGLDARGHNRWAVGSSLAWSHKPLVIWDARDPDKELFVVVQHQVYFTPGVAWMLWDRVRFEAQVPVLVVNAGERGTVGTTVFQPEQGAAFGDVRLGADAFLVGEPGEALRVGAGVRVHLPTGSTAAYASSGTTRLGPVAHVAGDAGMFAYGANLGVLAQAERQSSNSFGNQLALNVAGGVRLIDKRLTLGPELSLGTRLDNGGLFDKATTPTELTAGAHYQTNGGWLLGLGLGRGLGGAIGSPDLRGQASVTWVPPGVARDSDSDGHEDALDQCPSQPSLAGGEDPRRPGCPRLADVDEDGVPDMSDQCTTLVIGNTPDPARPGCPLAPDRDLDGVSDGSDRCPDQAAAGAGMDPNRLGCPLPLDRDSDGIADEQDQCPDEAPGSAAFDPTRPGCALNLDSDGDGILDVDDACPQEPAAPETAQASRGCPPARVEQGQITISEQIPFKRGTAELSAESADILQAVAKALNEHSEISLLGIEGYTDSSGKSALNQALSAQRAQIVRQRLIEYGVAPERLKTAGFGDARPIASNEDEAGRTKNRRVQFTILSRSAAAPE